MDDHFKKEAERILNDPIVKEAQRLLKDPAIEAMRRVMEQEKKLIESFRIPKEHIPEMRMPRRQIDCAAAPVCEAIGNLRNACCEGSASLGGIQGPGIDGCISSMILLISRLAGMWPEEMVQEVEEKRKIGFGIGGLAADKNE